ncbi:MAG: glucose-6-phosphate isomerase [Gammaproteobacteria bacterium]|nr:glucose-6-phosphate isomerase [Gammaproteobacteria bacterium]
MSRLRDKQSWQALKDHFDEVKQVHMRDLFAKDKQRFEKFSIKRCGILLDYSKNRITEETLARLVELARESDLRQGINDLFSGARVNTTEQRPALHTALRNLSGTSVFVDGEDIMPSIQMQLDKMRSFVNEIYRGSWRGYNGQAITDVVNIGIGGSDLGPVMVTEALKPYRMPRGVNVHFMSNVDGSHVVDILNSIRPETTLFIIASKSFTTQESLSNALTVRRWMEDRVKDSDKLNRHFIAVTANKEAALEFGIPENHILEFWDWVGGRYSLWSAVGLSIAIYLGMDNFEELLAGANEMDIHFRNSPFDQNMPVLMALLGIWYNNFFGGQTHAILPYDQHLHRFSAYFQQGDMESNGKSVTRDGEPVDYTTGPIIWGETGTNGQHAYFQLLHQGTRPISADFIAPVETYYPINEHQTILLANFFAQTRALMMGKTEAEVREELEAEGRSVEEIERLAPHKVLEGNRPTNTLLIDKITPRTLGSLIALYEHKIFVQGYIWNINPFDQWGVEFGKKTTSEILDVLMAKQDEVKNCDASTHGLMQYFKQNQY